MKSKTKELIEGIIFILISSLIGVGITLAILGGFGLW